MIWRPVGIVGAGGYIPDFRIAASEIDSELEPISGQMTSKSIPGQDEDATTMAVEAAVSAIADANIDASDLDAIWVGSESKPHAVRSITATVTDAVGAGPWVGGADFEFACRGAAEAFIAAAERIESGHCRFILVIASDAAQGAPKDELERTAGAGAAAFVLGKSDQAIALISPTVTSLSDTPDFFRRDGAKFPRHTHRFTGEPAYFSHVESVVRKFLETTSTSPADYRYGIFHQPNQTFPRRVAKNLGFELSQVDPLMLFQFIGNPYAANWALSVINAIEKIKTREQVLVSTYGSGAGADCFAIQATHRLQPKGRLTPFLHQGCQVNYSEYLSLIRALEG